MPEVVLNQLYKHTDLQTSVSILMLALLDNKPMIFNLRDLIREFTLFRQEVVYKRTQYDLKKAKEKEHILEGLIIALSNIDEVIELIKKSQNAEEAILTLNKRFMLTDIQAKAILEMRLQRLTGLEQDKIHAEIKELKNIITDLRAIIEDKERLKLEVVKELEEVKENYGDARRSKIEGAVDILTEADLIPVSDVVVTLTKKGYIKRVCLDTYGVQHRGGKGKMGMVSLDESDDVIEDVFVAQSHDELLFFTNLGRIYSMKVFEVRGFKNSKRTRDY